eukprot:9501534-Pyramimonas_sp.AAC.1
MALSMSSTRVPAVTWWTVYRRIPFGRAELVGGPDQKRGCVSGLCRVRHFSALASEDSFMCSEKPCATKELYEVPGGNLVDGLPP